MMRNMTILITILVLLISASFSSAKKPRASYIHPCSKSDPHFDECCLLHGREALPYILQGDKEYRVPKLTPFEVQLVSLDTGGLKISIHDLLIYGLDRNDLKQVKFDLNNKNVTVRISFETISLIGKYEFSGKMVMIPLEGIGRCNFTVVDIDVVYSLTYKLEEIDGEEYFAIDKATSRFTCKGGYFDIHEIFGDNTEVGVITNKAMNDNWSEIIEAIEPAVDETIVQIGNTIINGFGGTVPFKDVFLD